MTNTDILLEDLEDVLDDATSIPLSKKCAVDVDKISREACNELKSFNRNDEFLQNLFVYLIHREK